MRSSGQFYFFYDKITNTKSTRKHQKALKCTKMHQKALKNTTNLRFIKLKKHLIGKNNFLFIFFFYDKITNTKSTKKH